jgi:TPR repeat protein
MQAAGQRGDYAMALRLVTPLAEAGNLQAEKMLGSLYGGGFGVPKDGPPSFVWYMRRRASLRRECCRRSHGIAANGLQQRTSAWQSAG